MKTSINLTRSLITILFTIISVCIWAQEQTGNTEYVPRVGQSGKDVIWVPTPDELVNKMMEIAEVSSKDYVIDLGSGDGRTVIAAAKLGANALGIEYNPEMVDLSIKNAEKAGVSKNSKFIKADLFEFDFSEATVITMFLLPEINLKLRPLLLDLKPGTRIVSNTFTMGEWEPDFEVSTDENMDNWSTAHMWIVPAKVGGTWKLLEGELIIRQEFQMVYGSLKSGKKTSIVKDGRIKGDMITFSIDDEAYSGNITGEKTMEGTMTNGVTKKEWTATFTGR